MVMPSAFEAIRETRLRRGSLERQPLPSKPRVKSPASPVTGDRLVDRYGRMVTYLRLSITDRCDFRCTYCMPANARFLPREQILSLDEALTVVRAFVSLGVSKVRITGGEPLVRKGAISLMQRIAALAGVHELVLTTNGSQLDRFAPALKAAGVSRLNISVDSLDTGRFRAISRVGDLRKVLRGLEAAQAAGFSNTKLNCVLMRGVNDHEIGALVAFAIANRLDISFIEELPLREVTHDRAAAYMSYDEALNRLRSRYEPMASVETSGGPARYWLLPGTDTRVGLIAPHSHNFCAGCNRVRVSARGVLYPCLGQNDAVDLLPALRAHGGDLAPLRTAIIDSMAMKSEGHDFNLLALRPKVARSMSITGG